MTVPALVGVTVVEAATLPLGRLLSREQVLLWLDCTEQDLDQAVADGRVLAVRYADAPEQYPQVQFNRRRCPPDQVAIARGTFGPFDQSGVLVACWLACTGDALDLVWRGARISVVKVNGWPVVTLHAL